MNKYKEMSIYELQQVIETEPMTKTKKRKLITLINKRHDKLEEETKKWLNSPLFRLACVQIKRQGGIIDNEKKIRTENINLPLIIEQMRRIVSTSEQENKIEILQDYMRE